MNICITPTNWWVGSNGHKFNVFDVATGTHKLLKWLIPLLAKSCCSSLSVLVTRAIQKKSVEFSRPFSPMGLPVETGNASIFLLTSAPTFFSP